LDGIYNIGTGKNHSISEIIALIGKILNKTITIKYEEPTIYDTMYTLADYKKISPIGRPDGWDPKMKFVDGIIEQIEWQKKQLGITT